MEIFNRNGQLLYDIKVDDTSYRYRAIMGDDTLTLYFSYPIHIEIPVGAYCVYDGTTYTLIRPESLNMVHSRCFEYTVTMESAQANAKIWKFRNTVDGRLRFPFTAKPIEHLQLFVDNMNSRDSGWSVGDCIDGVEQLISYDHTYCWDALGMMAETFETEFEIVGKVVSLHKVEYNKSSPLPLSYGKGNGFVSGVGRTNYNDKTPTEILYVQGGERNIDPSIYGSQYLHLPQGVTIGYDGTYFEGDDNYPSAEPRIYVTDMQGYSVRRNDKPFTTLAEESLDCSAIYPSRVGKVTGVNVVDANKNYYDIIDNTIPEELDYEDCIIAGEQMTIIFQSGMLAGKEFDVSYHHDERRFEIVPQEIDGQIMPNRIYCPQTNDEYAIFHCMLPSAYINDPQTKSGAEWDMLRKAVLYLYENEDASFSFTGTLDGIWAANDWTNIGGKIILGGYIRFTDARFQTQGIDIRIIGIKDYINTPHSPEIELSNQTVRQSFRTSMQMLQSQPVETEMLHQQALQFTKRRYRDAQETMEMLNDALLNYGSSINPITVQTMSLLVGDESLQFRFIDSIQSQTTVAHSVTYDKSAKRLSAPSGLMQHMTLGIGTLSSQHSSADYLYWQVNSYMSARLTDGSKKYYLYIRASKNAEEGVASTAIFYLSETAKAMVDTDYYYFLYGVLNSKYDGDRSFVTLHGFTEILPARVTTDRVVSGNGQSYFDMVSNAMKLGDALDFNSNGDGRLTLKGTFVQSTGGISSPIGCWRGTYDSSAVYYQGDEVTYELSDIVSTYRYINSTPSSIAPNNTTYWQVVAQGSRGNSVSVKGNCVAHYADMAAWGQDSHADYEICLVDTYDSSQGQVVYTVFVVTIGSRQEIFGTPASAGDSYVMASDGHLWTAGDEHWIDMGQFRGQDGAAGKYTEYRYQVNGSSTNPTTQPTTQLNPSGWDTQMPTSVQKLQYVWMINAQKSGDGQTLLTNWSTAIRVNPMDGYDGVGVSSITEYYALSTSSTNRPTSWSTSVPTMTNTMKYLWNYAEVMYTDGSTGQTDAVVIGAYGDKGRGISRLTEMYLASSQSSGVTKQTQGWTSSVQLPTAEKPYLYNYEIITFTDSSQASTDVVMIGHYGRDGEKGADALPVAVCYQGAYNDNKTYYGNTSRVDVVKYQSAYYVARTDIQAGSFHGHVPTDTDYWNPFGGSFESVATDLLLAELANVGGFIFRRGRLESQLMADGTTTDGTTTKTPMIYIDGVSGDAIFAGGRVRLNSDGSANLADGKMVIGTDGSLSLNSIVANNGRFNGRLNASGGMLQNYKIVKRLDVEHIDYNIGTFGIEDSIIYVEYSSSSSMSRNRYLTLTFSWQSGQSSYAGQKWTVINKSQRTQRWDGSGTYYVGYIVKLVDNYGRTIGEVQPEETKDVVYIGTGSALSSEWIVY